MQRSQIYGPTGHSLCRNGFAVAQLIPVRLLIFLSFLRIRFAPQGIFCLIHLTLLGSNRVLSQVHGLYGFDVGKFKKSHADIYHQGLELLCGALLRCASVVSDAPLVIS